MLDINYIRKNPEDVKRRLGYKKVDPQVIDTFLELDKKWRELTEKVDQLRAKMNVLSKERNIEEAKKVKEELKVLEAEMPTIEIERNVILDKLPNLPKEGWLLGQGEEDNKVLKNVGEKPVFDFVPKDYLTIAEGLGIIDVDRAAKVSGSRFGYLFGEAVLLEFALINYAFQKLSTRGFKPVVPPVMIKPDVYRGMRRLAAGAEDERYYLPKDDLFLVGSSEHTIGPIHKDEILKEEQLPLRYAGFSTCFRRESGSYGKDTKGILRVHQFDKVELFSFAHPLKSEEEHQFLLATQEELITGLGLHYQVLQNCTGDMGFTDYAQYDINTWMPGQGKYRETNSCSNTIDFQARGINAKFKSADGNKYLHMLNATAFAIGRILIAIIENYQTVDGGFMVPEALRKYTGFDRVKPK